MRVWWVVLLAGCDGIGATFAPVVQVFDVSEPPQKEWCEQYLDCVDQVEPNYYQAEKIEFGDNSGCWDAGPDQAQRCGSECVIEAAQLVDVAPEVDSCQQAAHSGTCDEVITRDQYRDARHARYCDEVYGSFGCPSQSELSDLLQLFPPEDGCDFVRPKACRCLEAPRVDPGDPTCQQVWDCG